MITILATTKTEEKINQLVSTVERLSELIKVTTAKGDLSVGEKVLFIEENKIRCTIDWFDTEPPILFPVVPFSNEALMTLIFYKLGNEQQAFEYIDESHKLFVPLLAATNIKFGYKIESNLLKQLSEFNQVIVNHYGDLENSRSLNDVKTLYESVLLKAKDKEVQCLAAKHFVNLLLDAQRFEEAVSVCARYMNQATNEEAQNALRMLWTTAKTKGLQLPYDELDLLKIANVQVKCIDYLQEHNFALNAALLAMEASDISNYLNDYPTAKEYINISIKIFKEFDISEFLGEAGLKKANLLYNWSKNGSPQYYKASINAFQDVLKIFKRDSHPQQFAEIHHSLALIYSEIPAAPEEKAMWIAFSASSFKEALAYFTEEAFPYEYAMVCHNYATALMDFPPAKLHNNHEKANEFFRAALSIRTAKDYPVERALTLLNTIELGWLMHNENEQIEGERLDLMKKQAEEVLSLVTDENLCQKAKDQLNRLADLKELI